MWMHYENIGILKKDIIMTFRFELAKIIDPNAFEYYEFQTTLVSTNESYHNMNSWEILYYLHVDGYADDIRRAFIKADKIIELTSSQLLNGESAKDLTKEYIFGLVVQVYKWNEPINQANLSFEKASKYMIERYADHWSTPPKHLEVKKLVDVDDVHDMIRSKLELDQA